MGADHGCSHARGRQEAARTASRFCAVGDGRDDAGLSVPDLVEAHGDLCVSNVRSACVLRAHAGHRVSSRQSHSEAARSARIGCATP
jgi:hypothetical protein